MELIIDFDQIDDASKKEWLLNTLELMGIGYHSKETPQTIEAYNLDLTEGDEEIERGDFLIAEDLKRKLQNGSCLE